MSDSLRIILALCLVAGALFGEQAIAIVKNNVEIVHEPVVMVAEPTLEYKELVQTIVDLDISSEDAAMMTAFYLELANVVGEDDSVIQSTAQFRSFNMLAGPLHFNSSLKGKYDGLGQSIDEAIIGAIGKQSVELDDDKREDLIDVIEAIAWGVNR